MDWPLLGYVTGRELGEEADTMRHLDRLVSVHNPDLYRMWEERGAGGGSATRALQTSAGMRGD